MCAGGLGPDYEETAAEEEPGATTSSDGVDV